MTNKIDDDPFKSVYASKTAQSVWNDLKELKQLRPIRWIWELLQNASDASLPIDNYLIAEVKYRPGKLIFSHNGRSFEELEVAHLIASGSTKYEDDESIGEFGTGFLTTHLLSLEIEILGQLNDGRKFAFPLVRDMRSRIDLYESMKQAERDFKHSLNDPKTLVPQPFTTQFIYPIKDNAVSVVKAGIKTLEQCALYVVTFNKKFDYIKIDIDVKECRKILSLKANPPLELGGSSIQQITVTECENGNAKVKEYLLARSEKGTSVTVPLESDRNKGECVSVGNIPRIFKVFPLIGTESFSFPAVINSSDFMPTVDRDDVPLGESDDDVNAKNRAVIEEACALFVDLVEHAAENEWYHIPRWVKMPDIKNQSDFSIEWLRKRLKEKFVKNILGKRVVVTELGPTKTLKEACLPLGKNCAVKELWSLLNDLQEYREKLPRQDEAIGWCKVIESWAKVNECEVPNLPNVGVIDGRKLAFYIQNTCSNLKDLQNLLQEKVCAAEWLNQFYGFLKDNGLFDDKIRDLYIFPNQVGELNPLDNLYRDNEVDKGLKEIDNLLGGAIREQLLDTQLKSLENEMGARNLNNEDVVDELIDKLQARIDDNSDQDFKKASTLLFAWIVNSNQKDYLDLLLDVPVFTKDGEFHHSLRNTVHNAETLLAPICSWPKDLQECQNIFPPNRILADAFFKEVNDSKVWEHLEKEGFVKRDMITKGEKIVNSQDFLLVGELGEDDKSHESDEEVFVTNIMERAEIMRRVKGNSNYAPRFWKLLTRDLQGLEIKRATYMSCETPHEFEYYPAEWLMRVREDKWIRGKDRGYSIPNAASLAQMLRDNKLELKFLTEDPVSNKLMEIIGVQQSDLRLEFIAEDKEKRDEVINVATTLYDSPQLVQHIQDNENFSQDIEKILEATGGDLSQIVEDIGEHKEQQNRMNENQGFGKQVEIWVKQILEQNLKPKGFSVTPKHTGSDLEILPETFDISTQEIIQNDDKKWLVEVKGTRAQNVKMSFEQTKNALDKKEEFLLCVVPIPEDTQPDFDTVRENILFIKNIQRKLGKRVATLCSSIDTQKDVTDNTPDDTSPGIFLDFEKGKAGIRVHESVWKNDGFPIEKLAECLK